MTIPVETTEVKADEVSANKISANNFNGGSIITMSGISSYASNYLASIETDNLKINNSGT